MNKITLQNVSVTKNKKTILQNVTAEIAAGKITGLIGPSGSGKTTLMRTIVGVQQITSGVLMIGEDAAGSKTLRSKIGYVTQSPAVYFDLTVQQNLDYFATLVGASSDEVTGIIKKVELIKQQSQLVDSLSGGQKARVSLAAALLGNPEVLILDEPTVGLDPILREELWTLFESLAESGKTLLVSSHVMDEADRCDNLLLIRDGRALWQGAREVLLDKTKTASVGDAFLAVLRDNKVVK